VTDHQLLFPARALGVPLLALFPREIAKQFGENRK
jgi:hypothetical protein